MAGRGTTKHGYGRIKPIPIHTDKRNGRLFVQFAYKGHTYKRYLPQGSSRADAKKLETKMRSDVFFQTHGLAPKNEILFEDFVQDFLESVQRNTPKGFKKAEYVLIAAKPFLKGKTLRQIKPSDIDRFVFARLQEPTMHGGVRKPATIWRELAILSRMFSLAIREDLADKNPVARIDKPKFDNIQTKVLARQDEAKFLAAFDEHQGIMARDICVLVLNTGLRQNDVLGLTAFNIKDGAIHLVQGKTKRVVIVPLNNTALEIVRKYASNGLLFPSPRTGKPMHYIRKAIAGACMRAGIEPVTIRDLRRTFATRLAEDGVDALTIALLLGHSDLRMVHRYARSMDAMKQAVEKLERRAA